MRFIVINVLVFSFGGYLSARQVRQSDASGITGFEKIFLGGWSFSLAGAQRTSYAIVIEMTVQAVYEDGVLRPLQPVPFLDHQELTVTISDGVSIIPEHRLLVSSEEWDSAAGDQIGLDEVRRALSTIRGSLSEAIIEERREERVDR